MCARWRGAGPALLAPGRPGVAGNAYGYPGAYLEDGRVLCEPTPASAAAALLSAAGRTCAVVSTRSADGEEQSVAVDLPKLGAWGPVILRQKIVQRLQAGDKVVLVGRHLRTLRLDPSVAELSTRACRADDL